MIMHKIGFCHTTCLMISTLSLNQNLSLGLPYPGDLHILRKKISLPVFVKLYYDAGMKELAVKFLHGTTLKIMIFPNKLRLEFDNTLDLGLPYPGDLHILKHLLHVFINIYYDAGMTELAVKFHHGTTLEGINRVH